MTVTVPLLPALDMNEAIAFYTRLGCVLRGGHANYALLSFDGAELHFWKCDERHIAENCGCYIRVADVDALHARWQALGGVRMVPPADKQWGQRELYVFDPSGNLLRFGQPVA